MPNLSDIAKILDERGDRYGAFVGTSHIAMSIKRVIDPYQLILADDQVWALHMIANKIGRILNGDPNYADSWADIAGYAKLVADRLEAENV